MRVVDQPKIPNAKELFEDMDADDSGLLDRKEVAQLYKKARGQKLSKSDLTAAMEEMDDDNSGEVDLSEFESWWSRNGGDLESQRSKAFTLVFQGGLELILVAPNEATKDAWVSACDGMLASLRRAATAAASDPEPEPKPEPAAATDVVGVVVVVVAVVLVGPRSAKNVFCDI